MCWPMRAGRRLLCERQGREAVCFSGSGRSSCPAPRRNWPAACWPLRHLQAGTRLAGGLLGGDQGGADLHGANPDKTGLAKVA